MELMEKVEGNYLANHHLGVIEINHAISRQEKRFTGYANSLERWAIEKILCGIRQWILL